MLSKRLLWHYGGPFYNFKDYFAKLSDFLINSKRAISFLISLFLSDFLVLIDKFVGCTTVLVSYVLLFFCFLGAIESNVDCREPAALSTRLSIWE